MRERSDGLPTPFITGQFSYLCTSDFLVEKSADAGHREER